MSDTDIKTTVSEQHDWREMVKGNIWRNCIECGAIGEFDPGIGRVRELRCHVCGRVAKFYGNDGKPVCSEHA